MASWRLHSLLFVAATSFGGPVFWCFFVWLQEMNMIARRSVVCINQLNFLQCQNMYIIEDGNQQIRHTQRVFSCLHDTYDYMTMPYLLTLYVALSNVCFFKFPKKALAIHPQTPAQSETEPSPKHNYPPRKLTWQWKIHHLKSFEDVFPIENRECHVSFQGCTLHFYFR